MTGDFTSAPLRDGDTWTGARLQQGRVLLDGDWNLNIDAAARERRQFALEAIGPAGVQQGSTGFQIGFAADGTLQIGAGAMWVGGLYAVNPAVLGYLAQEAIAALPASGRALVYLDAFVQDVQAAEDSGLLDPALDGVDTTTRTRVAWRVRAVPVTATDCADAAASLPGALISSGRLDIAPTAPAAPADPCAPPDDPRGKLPDGLLRVEVLDSGTETTARFAWSYENGAAAVAATVAGATVTLAPSPSTTFFQNDLVEVSTLVRRADRANNGPLFSVAAVEPSAGGSVVTLATPSAVTGTPSGLCLRRWDGQVTGAAAPAVAATLAGADVGVAFTARPGNYLAGDWWVTRVRGSGADAVDTLTAAQPDGTAHYVASLAVVDLTAKAVLSDCRPQFPALTAIGGCCTLNVAPSDAASLQGLLAGFANKGPVTVCLAPGTYTLPAPLIIGPQLTGVTLQGCAEGAVIAGPAQPGPEFTLGLIVVQGASTVTIRDVELSVPLVGFTPAADAFSGLPDNNKALLGAFANGLQVAIGISASDSPGLAVTGCTFSFPDPGQANVLGAGIYALGAVQGAEIAECTFGAANPPVTAPFHDLAAGTQAPPPYQLTFGYLQVATAPEPGSQQLHDSAIRRCVFQGVTVPVFAMTQLGTVRIEQNTARNCYGGFWFYSIADPSTQLTLFDSFAVGNPVLFTDLAAFGGAALCDRIVPIATAMARVLPITPPSGNAPQSRRIGPPSPQRLAQARQAFTSLFSQVKASGVSAAAPAAEEEPAAEEAHLAQAVGIAFGPGIPVQLETLLPPADTGTSVIPRLDVCDCQVDAVISESYSGAALILADLAQSATASILVHGNRMRTRFASGEAIMGLFVAQASVTGNIIVNEVPVPAPAAGRTLPNSFSLTLLGIASPLGTPALAISGNVLIDTALIPGQNWQALNTVIGYSVVPAVTAISPGIAGVGATVTITGTGFTAATQVQFGAVAATSMTIQSDTQISATVPAGTGAVDISVTTPAGTSPIGAADRFTYLLVLQ